MVTASMTACLCEIRVVVVVGFVRKFISVLLLRRVLFCEISAFLVPFYGTVGSSFQRYLHAVFINRSIPQDVAKQEN